MADGNVAASAGEAVNASIDAGEGKVDQVTDQELEAADEAESASEEPAVEAKKPEAIKADLKKKLKLKVDGQEIEEEIDLADEEGLKKHLQQSKAFNKRSQELSQYQKQVTDFMEQLKSDPSSVLEQLGFNVDDFAEKRIEKMIENAKKSPEQLEKEQMANELKSLKDKLAKEENDRKNAELEQMKNQYAAEIEADINKALEAADTVLPKKNPWVLRKVAEYMSLAMKNGYPQVTAKDVIGIVESDFRSDLESIFDVLPEATMEKVINKKNLDRLRKQRLRDRKVQTQTANQVVKSTGTRIEQESDDDKPRKTYKSIFRYDD